MKLFRARGGVCIPGVRQKLLRIEIRRVKPVSYTHLDVYKRQVQGAAAAGIRPVLIQRTEGQEYEDVTVIRRLTEALTLL